MPKIIVQVQTADGKPGEVTLAERVVPADAQSDHYLAQLVERIGWALLDAEDLEAGAERSVEERMPFAHRSTVGSPNGRSVRQTSGIRRRAVLGPRLLRAPK
jgi:hypothetical protein